jgi:ABC-type transport system involved in cytochrome c biogenesis permease component
MVFDLSKKSISRIVFEGLIVGICLIIIYKFFEYFLKIEINGIDKTFILLFISGFCFHIIFEYIGLNIWYAKDYCKLI